VLRVDSGTLTAKSAAGVEVSGTGWSRTFTGSIAALNRYFTNPAGRIRYRPAANATGAVGLRMSVAQRTGSGVLRSSAATTIAVAPVNDAPTVRAPATFRVVEDIRGRISWATIATPFSDVDSPNLTVTLSVADGVIDAESGYGVTVGGTNTARTFSGTTSALNAYFKSLGRITYTTAPDSTAERLLTTTVSDGSLAATAQTRIVVTPANDRPTLATAVTLTAKAGKPLVITHKRLLAASSAYDVDGDPLRFRIKSLVAGRLEKWNGFRWVAVQLGGGNPTRDWRAAPPVLGPGERMRWVPPAGATGTIEAFTIRAEDGRRGSTVVSRVSIAING
jgi:hypothetical protein